MNDRPTPDERREHRLAAALVELDPAACGPMVHRLAIRIVEDLPPTTLDSLVELLERPGLRQRLLEQRLRDERYAPLDTTTVEGLTRSANDRAAVLEDLAARRAARR